MEIPPEEMEVCLQVLHRIANYPPAIKRMDVRFHALISKIYREGKRLDTQVEKKQLRDEDRALRATTAMVTLQRDGIPAAALPAFSNAATSDTAASDPASSGLLSSGSVSSNSVSSGRTLNQSDSCYICKQAFVEMHFFYHLLCPTCAEFNYRMRSLRADLTGRTALVTGGRVKIGFQTVLRLLRDGARVIVTTRFPHVAARRFHAEADSAEWEDRLLLYGLDLRNIPAVEAFARQMLTVEPHLDIIIHNAAQTIRRPQGFYQDLMAIEQAPHQTLSLEACRLVHQGAPTTLGIADSSALLPAVIPGTDVLPADALEDNEERADSRSINSWLLRLDEVSAPEMLEVQLVNSVAPFLLNSRLKALLMRSPFSRRFIINVSAMEGQFRRHKTVFHPHTNMAKAALNMMTRTSGEDYAKDGIYMNSVDTGWVTDENPTPKRTRLQEEKGFFPPLDIIDSMARIYHPIAHGITREEEPLFGLFLKDYTSCPW